jgi:hypothetical protein
MKIIYILFLKKENNKTVKKKRCPNGQRKNTNLDYVNQNNILIYIFNNAN